MSFQTFVEKQNDIAKMEDLTKEITEDLISSRATIKNLTKTLEDRENENKVRIAAENGDLYSLSDSRLVS